MQNRQLYRDISLRPKTTQFFIDELPLLFVAITGLVYGGMDDAPLGSIATLFAVLFSLYLAYRLIYLKRIRYHIGGRTTDGSAWHVPTQHRLYRTVPSSGFSRTPDPVTTDFRTENGNGTLYGQDHTQAGSDWLAQTDSHRGTYQGTC